MQIGRNGMVSFKNAKESGLPIFDFRFSDVCEAEREFMEEYGYDIGLNTEADLKILRLYLTKEQRENPLCFRILPKDRGCTALYSLKLFYKE